MPQPFGSGDELSLRHLPDVSDSSFSFQIPGAVRGDNLLADDGTDFFKGTDVSVAPLASPPTTAEPLFTLSQLTPKSEVEKLPSSKDGRKLDSFPTLSYDHYEDHDTNPKQLKAPHQPRKITANVNVLSKPKSKVIITSSTAAAAQLPSCEGSPATVRLGNIRTELNLFNDNLLVGPSGNVSHQELTSTIRHKPKGILKRSLEKKQPQRISPRNNQKVIEGGISKTRCTTKLPSICHHDGADALPIQQDQNTTTTDSSRLLSQQAEQNGDLSFADSSMNSAAEGVAGRLVMYSQKLINSFGLFNSEKSLEPNSARQVSVSQDHEAVTNANVVQDQVPHEADRPLTLSQLSPHKYRDRTPTPLDDVPMMSPLRLPAKRSVSTASDVLQKCKKSKTDVSSSADIPELKLKVGLKARLPATKRHPKPISSNSSLGLRLNDRSTKRKPTSTRINGPGIKRLPVFKLEGSELDEGGDNSMDTRVANSASSSRCPTSGRQNDAEPMNSITSKNKGKSVASSSQGTSRAVYHAPQPATRPVPFNFQADKRGTGDHKDKDQDQQTNDARERSESQKEKRLHSSTTIPDFKAMHAAQEAELALRKENIQPVVPLPIRWETDHRLKERQKFDERVREREREQERLMDLRRKEREEQEEREVRELRKKTVPKAHEVPEWYKEAPKKKKVMVDSIGR